MAKDDKKKNKSKRDDEEKKKRVLKKTKKQHEAINPPNIIPHDMAGVEFLRLLRSDPDRHIVDAIMYYPHQSDIPQVARAALAALFCDVEDPKSNKKRVLSIMRKRKYKVTRSAKKPTTTKV